jgi:ComF family protein
MNSFAKDVLVDFVSLLYPRYCFACNEGLVKGEENICSRCILEIPRTQHHLDPENALFTRLRGRIALKSAFAFFFFQKGGRLQHLLHALKYSNHPELGEMIGEVYGHELRQAGFDRNFDVIVPVPLHPTRKRQRGYNQSEEFGKGLSKTLNVAFADALMRTRKTETQTRKTKLGRWQNVSEVFQVNDLKQLQKRHVLLVDDVITTGATIEACAEVLLAGGAASVSISSIAYAEEGK